MAPRLVESASGLRHLRWAREVLGALEVHFEHDPRLGQHDRDAVLHEMVELRAEIVELSASVKAYRDFLERERTKFRGMMRVGQYLEQTAATPDERADAAAIVAGFGEAFASMEERERLPRKRALREAVVHLRQAVREMDERLGASLPSTFVDSLYPALSPACTHVADAGDDDDDATT